MRADRLIAVFFISLARLVTGVMAVYDHFQPDKKQRIYFANHASHGDLIVLMAAFDSDIRENIRAVAGADYWDRGPIRRFIATRVLNVLLVERQHITRQNNPLLTMGDALENGLSLVIFPEGTRNVSEMPLLPFRSGLYQLARKYPEIELVPCWIENMTRILPKGSYLPVPLLSRVYFGAPTHLLPEEHKGDFLMRMQDQLLQLSGVSPVELTKEHI